MWTSTSFFSLYENGSSVVDRIFAAREFVCEENRLRSCPNCKRNLTPTRFSRVPELIIDQCYHCNGIWFDVGELNVVPSKGEVESEFPARTPTQRRSVGANEPFGFNWPSENLPESVALHPFMMLGLPLVDEKKPAARVSVVCTLIALASTALSIEVWRVPPGFARYAFFPSEPLRNHGFTLISSTFVHGGIWHLLSNLYFLFVCGNTLEEESHPRFVGALFWASAVVGDLAYAFSGAVDPSVGASGGIAGLMIFYALAYPKNRVRIGLIRGFEMSVLNISALQAGFAFLLLQGAGAAAQLVEEAHAIGGASAMSNPNPTNYLAHLKGAFIGALAYALYPPAAPKDHSSAGLRQ